MKRNRLILVAAMGATIAMCSALPASAMALPCSAVLSGTGADSRDPDHVDRHRRQRVTPHHAPQR